MNKIEPYKGIANTYDEIRPSYPEKLIQDIISRTDLKLEQELGKQLYKLQKKGSPCMQ